MPIDFGRVARPVSEAKMIETVHNLEQWDRESQRLEWAARLRGDSAEELRDLIRAREDERERLARQVHGRSGD